MMCFKFFRLQKPLLSFVIVILCGILILFLFRLNWDLNSLSAYNIFHVLLMLFYIGACCYWSYKRYNPSEFILQGIVLFLFGVALTAVVSYMSYVNEPKNSNIATVNLREEVENGKFGYKEQKYLLPLLILIVMFPAGNLLFKGLDLKYKPKDQNSSEDQENNLIEINLKSKYSLETQEIMKILESANNTLTETINNLKVKK